MFEGSPSPAPQILLVGASARAAAHALAREGWELQALDLFGDQDLQEVCRGSIALAGLSQPDVARGLEILMHASGAPNVWFPVGGLENEVDSWAWLDQQIPGFPGLSGGSNKLHQLRSVSQWKAWSEEAAAGFPEIRFEPPSTSPHEWLYKSTRTSGGLGVRQIAEGENWDKVESSEGGYWQRKVKGVDCSALAVCHQGQAHWIGATKQLCGIAEFQAPPFLYSGSIGPIELGEHESTARKLLEVIARSTNWTGLLGIDFRIDSDSFWLFEVNPRYPAGAEVLERSAGQSVIGYLLRLCLGEPATWRTSQAIWMKGVWWLPSGETHCVSPAAWERVLASGESGRRPIADVSPTGSLLTGPCPAFTLFSQASQSTLSIESLVQLGGHWETLIFDLN